MFASSLFGHNLEPRFLLLNSSICVLQFFRLQANPENLEQLAVSIALLESLQKDFPKTEARIPPLHEQFAILGKYEVDIPENVSAGGIRKVFLKVANFIYHSLL